MQYGPIDIWRAQLADYTPCTILVQLLARIGKTVGVYWLTYRILARLERARHALARYIGGWREIS